MHIQKAGCWTGPNRHVSIPTMNNTPPPTIIAFVSPKGGVGKSTCCLSLAAALAHKGHPVSIVDFDQTETLWRWHSSNEAARNLPNLTVEKGPDNLERFINDIWQNRCGFVFIDLAGNLTHQSLLLATFAELTITPSKLNEPDIVEAAKLAAQLKSLGAKIGKPIAHRILINEVPMTFMPTHQAHTLDQLDRSHLQRFETLIHTRAAFPETWLTGTPPHFADRNRQAIAKAVEEIDHLAEEFLQTIQHREEETKEAA